MSRTIRRWWMLLPAIVLLAACGSQPPRPTLERGPAPNAGAAPAKRPAPIQGGGYYQDDGPGAHPPKDLLSIPDAVPRWEPLNQAANRPYSVFGREYVPLTHLEPYSARGMASWYGRKFNGQKTSDGEIYDMYGMSAAHPTLPIPSYARVTNLNNGRSVVVRINDRGPFLENRLIDLSYTAAAKLGIIGNGSAPVEVDSILPGQTQIAKAPDPIEQIVEAAQAAQATQASAPEAPARLPETQDVGGVYLQLGAFGNRDNAEGFKSRLEGELQDLGGKLLISATNGIYRVKLGPWQDDAEARRIAERLRRLFKIDSMLVVNNGR